MANDRGLSTWDILRSLLSVAGVLLAALASYSARLLVKTSDNADAELSRRVSIIEAKIDVGTLPRTDARLDSIETDIRRIERDLEKLRDGQERIQPRQGK